VLVFKKVAEVLASRGHDADIDRWIRANPTFLAYRSIIDECAIRHAALAEGHSGKVR
jgi:hypothetical protein